MGGVFYNVVDYFYNPQIVFAGKGKTNLVLCFFEFRQKEDGHKHYEKKGLYEGDNGTGKIDCQRF